MAAAFALAGCASITPDRGLEAASQLAHERTGVDARLLRGEDELRALDAHIDALLREPLGMDAAVRIALLRHPGLQATYWELGIAQSDLVQASRLPNPSLGFSRLHNAHYTEIERSLSFDLAGLLTLPLRQRMEARRYEQAKLTAAAAMERHALETRRAWVEAVAARQAVAYARQVAEAHEAAAELTGRMAQAGNASQLDLARERAAYAEAGADVLRAQRAADGARETLTRQLGLWGKQAGYTLPERLPDLPAAPAEPEQIERLALERRFDVRAAREQAAATAADLGLTRSTRFVNVLELGVANKSETGEPRAKGYEVGLELPLFDWGGARVAKAEAVYMQALNRVAETAITARSEAREHYLGYRASYDIAQRYRDEIIPQRKKIADETLLRYNGMLASTFELLADAREQVGAVNGYLDALKDFWLAHAALEGALGGRVGHAPAHTNKEHQQ
ncbi:RND transporter [Massilia sp. KIM]|nr:RND transporter [Massilia sp. KIM]